MSEKLQILSSENETPSTNLPAIIPPAALVLHRTQTTLGLLRNVVQESSAEYWYTLGTKAAHKQQWPDAEHSFKKALAVDIKHWRGQLQLAAVLAAKEQFIASSEALCSAFNMPFSSWLGFEQELSFLQWVTIRDAMEWVNNAETPNFSGLLALVLSKKIFNRNNLSEKLKIEFPLFTSLISSKKDFGLWHKIIEYGDCHLIASIGYEQYSEEAMADCDAVVLLGMNGMRAILQRATIKKELDDSTRYNSRNVMYNFGIEDFIAVLSTESQSAADCITKVEAELGNCYYGNEYGESNWEDILSYYNQAILHDPFDATLYVLRARHYFTDTRYNNLEYYNEIYSKENALADFNAAIKLNPRLIVHRALFKEYQNSDFEGALSDYIEVILLEPENHIHYRVRAGIKLQLNDINGAIDDFKTSYLLNTNDVSSYADCANIYINNLNDYESALSIYKQLLFNNSSDLKAYKDCAEIYIKHLNNYDGALVVYEQLLHNNPNNIEAYEERARIMSEYLSDYEGALREYRKSLAVNPGNLRVSTSIGALHTKFGYYNEALETLNAVIEADKSFMESDSIRELMWHTYSQRSKLKDKIGDWIGAENDHNISEDWRISW